MDDKDKMSLIAKLLNDHKRIYPHHSHLCELCKEAEAAIAAPAAPLPAQPEQKQTFPEASDDITCDQCIELEGELHREYARQAIAGTRTAASLLNEGAFRAGMEAACDELETRLKLEPDPKSEVPTTRDDMWCALLAATDAYLNSDPDPVIMIQRGDKQTWLALGTKEQITMMCDGRSGAQMERDAVATITLTALLPEQTGPSEALNALLSRIDDAAENYERFGEVCRFEGNSMVYAATLEEIIALRGEFHVARLAASLSLAPAQQQEPSLDAAIERAAVICESFCASDDDEDGINFILRQRAQRIRGLKSAETAAPGVSTEDKQ